MAQFLSMQLTNKQPQDAEIDFSPLIPFCQMLPLQTQGMSFAYFTEMNLRKCNNTEAWQKYRMNQHWIALNPNALLSLRDFHKLFKVKLIIVQEQQDTTFHFASGYLIGQPLRRNNSHTTPFPPPSYTLLPKPASALFYFQAA